MITIEKLRLYAKYGGNIEELDRFSKSETELYNDDDWAQIDSFFQDIELINNGAASDAYIEKVIIAIKENCDLEASGFFLFKLTS